MCIEREGGRKRGEAGARQGSRMGVLIKKRQIAAQQMISFSRHKTVVGVDKDAWDICKPWYRTYLANASAREEARVVIISIAASWWEDVNVWETNQFLVTSFLFMWFQRFISRCVSVTCSLAPKTLEQSAWADLIIHPSWQVYYTAGLTYFFM